MKKGLLTLGNTYLEEIIEKEILKRWLIKSGYMTNFQDLTNEELNKLMDFLITNKEFLK